MSNLTYGTVIAGREEDIRRSFELWRAQPVDWDLTDEPGEPFPDSETTLGRCVTVTGPGTFLGRATRTLAFEPTTHKGWWFDRRDRPGDMPILASVNNVWTTARNIVLSSGSPHNYMRMVEHIAAMKVGLGLDNVVIRLDSGDPPLFDRGSMDLVEAVDEAGIVTQPYRATYLTVKRPVTAVGKNGSFLTFLPAEKGSRRLTVDCAVDFRSAIGRQRIRFVVNHKDFSYGALARTNTTFGKMLYCRTIGKLFADVRNLGYTSRNILIAGPHRYVNEARIFHEGKSLEAVWHRAALDLLAAVGLITGGRFAGTIISYKAGHWLDVHMAGELYRHDLLETLRPA